jgi:type 1 glutamine amidotransferase
MNRLLLSFLLLAGFVFAGCAPKTAQPKRILLVTVTTGYRHSSIETAEKVLRELAAKSGEFVIVSTAEHPDYPKYATLGAADPTDQVRKVLATTMSAAALQTYDGIFFDSTVGELPLPDKAAFFKWVADGHAVMGAHAASDSLHETSEYAAMLGGEFWGHGQQAVGTMLNFDPAHPATAAWGGSRAVFDELYMFRPNYDRAKVHSLLSMTARPADGLGTTGAPGWFPVSWTKMYGKGRVFYTSLGHREDVWDPTWKDANGQRRNAPEVAEAFQTHLLGGIRWALGLAEGDTTPQPAAGR